MRRHPAKYIPAFRFNFLTPLFDPMMRSVMRELTFKRRLIQEARIEPGFRVLDLGSGTGTLTILVKQMHPDANVVGVDGDPNVLAIARAKAARQGAKITFDQGMAFQLPYSDQSFDRVLSSLVFHHLTTEDKERALVEVFRVLRPGGSLLIVDFGVPQNGLAWASSQLMRRLEHTEDLNRGVLPDLFRRAGFQRVEIIAHFMNVFGTLSLYRGHKPM